MLVVATANPRRIVCGATLRVSGIVSHLRTSPGIEAVHLACPVHPDERAETVAWAAELGVHLHPFEAGKPYLQWSEPERKAFAAHVEAELAVLDRGGAVGALVCGQFLACSLVSLAAARPMVADIVDEVTPHVVREVRAYLRRGQLLRAANQYRYMRAYQREHRRLLVYRAVLLTAHDDADRFARFAPGARVVAVPNGVGLPELKLNGVTPASPVLLFHGSLDYVPNDETAMFLIDEVAPALARRVPGAELRIVGRRASERLRAAAARAPNVTLVGEVPDVYAELRRADLGVYPVLARTGIQNKILEAWSVGLPVITSTAALDVMRFFDDQAPGCARVADDGPAVVRAAEELLADAGARHALAERGRALVERSFAWQSVADRVAELCRRFAAGTPVGVS